MADDLATRTPADESLRLAIRSTLVMGVVCTAFGLIFIVLLAYLNRYERFRPYFLAMGVGVWFGPGVVFLAAAYLMRRSHSRGAATGAMVTAGFQALCAAALLVLSATAEPVSPLPVVLGALWMIADVDCMRRLASARRLLGAGAERTRGFDAIVARPVLPAEPHHPNDSDRGK